MSTSYKERDLRSFLWQSYHLPNAVMFLLTSLLLYTQWTWGLGCCLEMFRFVNYKKNDWKTPQIILPQERKVPIFNKDSPECSRTVAFIVICIALVQKLYYVFLSICFWIFGLLCTSQWKWRNGENFWQFAENRRREHRWKTLQQRWSNGNWYTRGSHRKQCNLTCSSCLSNHRDSARCNIAPVSMSWNVG